METAKVAIKNKAGIGFVFDKKSLKYIDPLKASKISEVLSKDIYTIGIFNDPSDEELTYCLNKIDLSGIQLNGNESKERVEFIKLWFSYYPLETHLGASQSLPPKYKKTRRFKRSIIKAISVNTKKDLENDILKLYNAYRQPIEFKRDYILKKYRSDNNQIAEIKIEKDLDNYSTGSNNWAISGEKSFNGYPLLANDPHRTIAVSYTHLTLPTNREV